MNVYGIGQDEKAAYSGVIPIMLRKIREGLTPIINGDGSQAYDFINVRDVARANVLAMESDVEDVNLNIGTGVQTSIHHLCKKILELTGSELDVEYLPYSDEDSRRMVKNRISSTEMAKSLINFQYLISLENGLKEIIKSFEINDQK
jgi:UDP-glucose 4-epimerase